LGEGDDETFTTTKVETFTEEEVVVTADDVDATSFGDADATVPEDAVAASAEVLTLASDQACEGASSELDDQYSVTSPPSEDTVVEVDADDSQVMEPVDDFWGST